MKEGKKLIVTIGRQYGSGGSEIGARLAKEDVYKRQDQDARRQKQDGWRAAVGTVLTRS